MFEENLEVVMTLITTDFIENDKAILSEIVFVVYMVKHLQKNLNKINDSFVLCQPISFKITEA